MDEESTYWMEIYQGDEWASWESFDNFVEAIAYTVELEERGYTCTVFKETSTIVYQSPKPEGN